MVVAKSLDVVARMPGMAGSAADCVSAYTQVKNAGVARLLELPRHKCPVVWIRIPKDRWPKWWHEKGFVDLVVPLLVNLYGHPLAGLLWENTWKRSSPKVDGRNYILGSAYTTTEKINSSLALMSTI